MSTGAELGGRIPYASRERCQAALEDVAIHEAAVAQHAPADGVADRLAELRSIGHEGVEFAALAAGIYRQWQVREKLGIKGPPGEIPIELRGVNAYEPSGKAFRNESPGELASIESPDRKERLETAPRQQALPIATDVFEKEITECQMRHPRPVFSDVAESFVKRGLVSLVGGIPLDRYFTEREANPFDLRFQHRAADSMDADAVVATRNAREQADDFKLRIARENGERERAVLAATPAQENRLRRHGV